MERKTEDLGEGEMRITQEGNVTMNLEPADGNNATLRRNVTRSWSRFASSVCTKKTLRRRLPFLEWAKHYSISWALADILAGITVAMTAIPQGIAYAAVAGLPLEYGLYSAFMGPIVYALFGTVKQVTVGPTAVMAVMTQQYALKGGPAYAVLLSLITGCEILLAGLANLGFLVDFISGPVISGFCSAAAVMISLVQLKSLLGLSFSGTSVIQVISGLFTHVTEIKIWDAVLGVGCILVLTVFKNLPTWKSKLPSFCCKENVQLNKALWLVSISRNALVVFVGCLTAYLLDMYELRPFTLTGYAKAGLPALEFPSFPVELADDAHYTVHLSSMTDPVPQNITMKYVGFWTVCSDIGMGFILVPLIAILEHVAIAKAFSAGKKTDCTQEMVALGLGTLMGSFVGSMPITASFGRSSVQSSSGAQTPFANFFNGLIVLLALGFLMPALTYIPKSVLASVIICAVFPMIEVEELKPMWKANRIDLIPFILTFFCCLFINMEYGILVGAGVHLFMFVYSASRPRTVTCWQQGNELIEGHFVIQIDRSLYFPGIERLRHTISKIILQDPGVTIILDFEKVVHVDYSAVKMLKSIAKEMYSRNQRLSFRNVSVKVQKMLQSMLPEKELLFVTLPVNNQMPSE